MNSSALDEHNEKPILGADNNAIVALLAINLVSFVILGLIKVIYYLESLSLAQYDDQIFQPLILSSRWLTIPWTLLSYNWIHDGFWILVGNMIWLILFGYTLQLKGANKHIFPIYFYGGIVGAITYIVVASLSAAGFHQTLFGAGASVTAIVVASIAYIPNYKFLSNLGSGISLWILGVVYLLLQGYFLLNANLVTAITILCSGLAGLFYIMLLKKGKDLGKWMHQLLHLLNNSLAPKS